MTVIAYQSSCLANHFWEFSKQLAMLNFLKFYHELFHLIFQVNWPMNLSVIRDLRLQFKFIFTSLTLSGQPISLLIYFMSSTISLNVILQLWILATLNLKQYLISHFKILLNIYFIVVLHLDLAIKFFLCFCFIISFSATWNFKWFIAENFSLVDTFRVEL